MERFDSKRVIRRTFGLIAANWTGLLLAALVLCAGPYFAIELVYRGDDVSMALSAPHSVWDSPGPWYFHMLVPVLPGLLFAIWAVQAALNSSGGKKPALPGIGVIITGLALLIFQSLIVTLGLLLLIVPGVILALMWAVSLPVLVSERPGMLKALSRSQTLTHGRRSQIFGLMILLALFHLVLWFAAAGAGGVIIQQSGSGVISAGLLSAPTAFIAILRVVGSAALYQELRWLEECDSREKYSLSKMTSGLSPAST